MRFFALLLALAACNVPPSPTPAAGAVSCQIPVAPQAPAPPPVSDQAWEVRFSPNGGCTDMEAGFVRSAAQSVHLQAYGFTSPEVADALCDAVKKPGVTDVSVVLDRSNLTDKHSMMSKVAACGVHVWVDSRHQIAHNKVTLVDGKAVETGSFNYTAAAEHGNAENCVILRIPELAVKYEAQWQVHKGHSEVHL